MARQNDAYSNVGMRRTMLHKAIDAYCKASLELDRYDRGDSYNSTVRQVLMREWQQTYREVHKAVEAIQSFKGDR